MNEHGVHDFGVVDDNGDFYEFHWNDDDGDCRLDAVIQTERGPRLTELAVIPVNIWKPLSERVIRELVVGMGETERTKKAPTLKIGINRLSPLIGRELVVLLWALMEVADNINFEAILHGWRELAREERWWLYAKGAAPGQRTGVGWRRALFHALSETTDSRSVEPVTQEKKSLGIGSRSNKKAVAKKPPESKKNSNGSKTLLSSPLPTSGKKQQKSIPVDDQKTSVKESLPRQKPKKAG